MWAPACPASASAQRRPFTSQTKSLLPPQIAPKTIHILPRPVSTTRRHLVLGGFRSSTFHAAWPARTDLNTPPDEAGLNNLPPSHPSRVSELINKHYSFLLPSPRAGAGPPEMAYLCAVHALLFLNCECVSHFLSVCMWFSKLCMLIHTTRVLDTSICQCLEINTGGRVVNPS